MGIKLYHSQHNRCQHDILPTLITFVGTSKESLAPAPPTTTEMTVDPRKHYLYGDLVDYNSDEEAQIDAEDQDHLIPPSISNRFKRINNSLNQMRKFCFKW